jgi:hypothetical protein
MTKLAFLGIAAALAGAVFAPLSRGDRSSSCGQSGWAVTAQGSPQLGSAGYYTWHDAQGWHLRLKADAGAKLKGRVSANALLGLSRTTPTLRRVLKAQARAFSFSLTATDAAQGIDFKAACASKLNFAFGATSSSKPASGTSSLPVFLGVKGQAPATSFGLSRPAVAGIAGRIMVSGNCPWAIGPGVNCTPAKPAQGSVRIETAASSREGGGGGEFVKTVQSDADGNFSTDLAPGHYLLIVEKEAGYPVPKPSVIDVEAGVVTDVVLLLDSGVR